MKTQITTVYLDIDNKPHISISGARASTRSSIYKEFLSLCYINNGHMTTFDTSRLETNLDKTIQLLQKWQNWLNE